MPPVSVTVAPILPKIGAHDGAVSGATSYRIQVAASQAELDDACSTCAANETVGTTHLTVAAGALAGDAPALVEKAVAAARLGRRQAEQDPFWYAGHYAALLAVRDRSAASVAR